MSTLQIEYYQLRYSSLKSEDTKDHTIYPEDLEADNKIALSFPGASGPGLKLEGRIKYLGHDVETAWIQSQNPQVYFGSLSFLNQSPCASFI